MAPRLAALLLALALLGGQAVPAEGQAALSVRAGVGSFTGGDFSGTPPGPTFGGAYHFPLDEMTEATLGIDYSRYGANGFVGVTTQIDYAASVLRRLRAGSPEILAGARMGYSTRSLSVVDEPAHTDGYLVGPTLSLRAPTPLGASVGLSVDVLYHAYEELIMYTSREYGTDQDGFRAVVRLGLLIPVPFLTGPDEEASPGGW
jgi:hypothetical protein